MEHKYYWEDFKVGAQREGGSRTVTREEIIEFALKYDPQPFHIDEERAKHSAFGGLIASGWQTVSIGMRLICELYLLDSASMGSPGVDEIRWTAPVHPGDTLRLKSIVLETRASKSRPEMGSVRSRSELYNQDGELVMHMTGTGFFRRRTPGAAA